jgi:aminopeptidase N
MEALKDSMKWDEEVFGREYDLDVFNIVAVADFNFGAMENKGLNIFNSRYILADPETATDSIMTRSRAWSRTNISTTGRATASPAATGSSSA